MDINVVLLNEEYDFGKMVCDVFQRAFSGFPWFENLTDQHVEKLWIKSKLRNGFACLVAVFKNKVIGAIWWDTPTLEQLEEERGAQLVSIAKIFKNNQRHFIWEREIVVDPDFQGRGVGMLMRKEFISYVIQDKEFPVIFTRMRSDNLPIIRIAQRLGFIKTGITVPSSQKRNMFHEYWLFDTRT